jgi:putative phosphoribosyl transferase
MSCEIEREAVRVGRDAQPGILVWPQRPVALIVFAQRCGCADAHCRVIAEVMHAHGLATLQFDLQGEGAAGTPDKAASVAVLTQRLLDAVDGLRQHPDVARLRRPALGLFGASSAAAAALQVAAARPGDVAALVTRGARVELAPDIAQVRAPTLLIVGGTDLTRLRLNRIALPRLQCKKRLEVVPGASNRFDEPGALDAVAHLAADWFVEHGTRHAH